MMQPFITSTVNRIPQKVFVQFSLAPIATLKHSWEMSQKHNHSDERYIIIMLLTIVGVVAGALAPALSTVYNDAFAIFIAQGFWTYYSSIMILGVVPAEAARFVMERILSAKLGHETYFLRSWRKKYLTANTSIAANDLQLVFNFALSKYLTDKNTILYPEQQGMLDVVMERFMFSTDIFRISEDYNHLRSEYDIAMLLVNRARIFDDEAKMNELCRRYGVTRDVLISVLEFCITVYQDPNIKREHKQAYQHMIQDILEGSPTGMVNFIIQQNHALKQKKALEVMRRYYANNIGEMEALHVFRTTPQGASRRLEQDLDEEKSAYEVPQAEEELTYTHEDSPKQVYDSEQYEVLARELAQRYPEDKKRSESENDDEVAGGPNVDSESNLSNPALLSLVETLKAELEQTQNAIGKAPPTAPKELLEQVAETTKSQLNLNKNDRLFSVMQSNPRGGGGDSRGSAGHRHHTASSSDNEMYYNKRLQNSSDEESREFSPGVNQHGEIVGTQTRQNRDSRSHTANDKRAFEGEHRPTTNFDRESMMFAQGYHRQTFTNYVHEGKDREGARTFDRKPKLDERYLDRSFTQSAPKRKTPSEDVVSHQNAGQTLLTFSNFEREDISRRQQQSKRYNSPRMQSLPEMHKTSDLPARTASAPPKDEHRHGRRDRGSNRSPSPGDLV